MPDTEKESPEQHPVDIFVSYGHVDDEPFLDNDKGWIMHFVNSLRNLVTWKMGRKENYRLWMDFCIKGSDSLIPEIKTLIPNTRTLVIC